MEFTLRHIGSRGGRPAEILELIITWDNGSVTESISDFNSSKVSDIFIQNIENILDEIKEHNEKVDNYGMGVKN